MHVCVGGCRFVQPGLSGWVTARRNGDNPRRDLEASGWISKPSAPRSKNAVVTVVQDFLFFRNWRMSLRGTRVQRQKEKEKERGREIPSANRDFYGRILFFHLPFFHLLSLLSLLLQLDRHPVVAAHLFQPRILEILKISNKLVV